MSGGSPHALSKGRLGSSGIGPRASDRSMLAHFEHSIVRNDGSMSKFE
jgi:hypothetical protein